MSYVLMLFIVVGGGPSVTSGAAMHEFNTKDSCEAAGRAAKAKWDRADWLCVRRSNGEP